MTLLDWILVTIALLSTVGQLGVLRSLKYESSDTEALIVTKVVSMLFLTLTACVVWIIELGFQFFAHGVGTPQFGWELFGLCVPAVVFMFVILTH